MRPKVAHLTVGHTAADVRIFHRECKTLRRAGYEVMLLAPFDRDVTVEGVRIEGLPAPWGGRRRMSRALAEAYRTALREAPDVCHLHDPELLPVGLLLKMRGMRVVYDVHEDLPKQLLSDARIPRRLRPRAAGAARLVERLAGRAFDGIVAAVPALAERFPTAKVVTVQNFPDPDELACAGAPAYRARDPLVAHIGGLKRSYGIEQLVDAMARLPRSLGARLLLAGRFSPPGFEQQVRARSGWRHAQFLGWQSRSGIASLLSRVRIGLAVLHPLPSYLVAYPVKLFEYMAAGIPAIVSDFPLWREIVGGAGCGLLVDPKDTRAIAEAIARLLRDPEEAEAMGERGRAMVHLRYNWQLESAKLLDFYQRLTR